MESKLTELILVCDDDGPSVERWSNRLRDTESVAKRFEILGTHEFASDIDELEQRRLAARTEKQRRESMTSFDRARILIVDYDLINAKGEHFLTGETVAYLARCYSKCGLILIMNQFGGDNAFDLTLGVDRESFADVNIGSAQLANVGLWTGSSQGFRPWHWPALLREYGAWEKRLDQIKTQLDVQLVDFFGFSSQFLELLSRRAREFVEGSLPIEKLTFRTFVETSPNVLQRKDKLTDDDQLSRVAAARLCKWLERVILVDEDLIVDAPHLVQRYPSLLRGKATEINSWNVVADLQEPVEKGINAELVAANTFTRTEWLSRPAWYGRRVSANTNIEEVKDPWTVHDHGFVFCEDLSRFLPKDLARQFVSDVQSPYARRYVSNPERLASAALARELNRVHYRPVVRFSF